MRETWFVMEDGSVGDPREIAPDAKGVLTHKDGRRVAYAPHGPRSRGVDAVAERAKARPPMTHNEKRVAAGLPPVEGGQALTPVTEGEREAVSPDDREMRPKRRGKGYETR